MPDAIFAHPRLAPVYDAFDGERGDLTAYLDIAGELGADRVLDIGCGTGSLAVLLAENGRTVTGVDPARASLEVARSKDKTAAVTWICGDAARAPAIGADLAVMTGNCETPLTARVASSCSSPSTRPELTGRFQNTPTSEADVVEGRSGGKDLGLNQGDYLCGGARAAVPRTAVAASFQVRVPTTSPDSFHAKA